MARVQFIVTVEINEDRLSQTNLARNQGGRAPITAAEVVEQRIADSLRHNFITSEFSMTEVKA